MCLWMESFLRTPSPAPTCCSGGREALAGAQQAPRSAQRTCKAMPAPRLSQRKPRPRIRRKSQSGAGPHDAAAARPHARRGRRGFRSRAWPVPTQHHVPKTLPWAEPVGSAQNLGEVAAASPTPSPTPTGPGSFPPPAPPPAPGASTPPPGGDRACTQMLIIPMCPGHVSGEPMPPSSCLPPSQLPGLQTSMW
ncbi:WAP four-disulfide core domain protein 1 isoform X4 [Acinonyx jubatus]|uniref:WAP four-disulfide core domain protein 1 isoform X4 n=1 Tax=Acinonyx jubatus TaxID=32536 RepID=A0ABM3P2Z5_ACIJB|nr:WAP four-disulfide core domain protein 1 isoform X4 [Acinonyx jubatus]